jgi:hypothetical protein
MNWQHAVIGIMALMVVAMTPPPAGMPMPQAYDNLVPAYATVQNPVATTDYVRGRVVWTASRFIGWREATGRNDGQNIDAILSTVGLQGRQLPYCAAFVHFSGVQAGYPSLYPRSGKASDMVYGNYWSASTGYLARPADTFGVMSYIAKERQWRIGHTGIVERDLGNAILTIEGNTGPNSLQGTAADREGQGIFRKRRLKSQMIYFKDWVSVYRGG